jgi:hypothetical protein
MTKCTLILSEGGTYSKISKIIFYGNGQGFGVLAPYHKAQKGFLMKSVMDPETAKQEEISLKVDDAVQYSASDRVKLSIHSDGFVQFSGENPQRILSGRDPVTGKPKGLGLFSNPLTHPVRTGPTFGMTIWGLGHFSPAETAPSGSHDIVFEEGDYQYRYADEKNWNGYVIEGFVFPPDFWPFSFIDEHGRTILRFRHPYFRIGNHDSLAYRVLPFLDEGNPYMVALLVSRTRVGFNQLDSGFIISAPSEVSEHSHTTMFACYPGEVLDLKNAESLDYLPKNS